MSDKEAKKEKDRYKKTLNLPKTKFSMRANLVQTEPNVQKRWNKMNLQGRLREAEHPKGAFVFHDGPPYANGSIHLGHLLNKVLKDLVVRTRTMAGYDVDFVPGWDCHGLPIEHRVMQNLGEKARDLVPLQIRHRCKQYAEKQIKLQATQMKRLGTLGNYENPYLTMNPHYEAAVIEVFAALVKKGLVYRAKKPVHWSIANQTALAEAELEYKDREDTSVYVLFELESTEGLPAGLNAPEGEAVHVMIWTTTPWTLPSNLAVAASERDTYALYKFTHAGVTKYAVFGEELAEKVFGMPGVEFEKLGDCKGGELAAAGLRYKHPFIDRTGPLLTADYVTMTDGTGLVHTAPGHGAEDFMTGRKNGLDVYCPVRADGTYDDTVPEWLRGMSIWKANDEVTEHLRGSGHLFHDHKFMHSYPHDWRSKTPTIFRATEQWFISVEKPGEGDELNLRDMALQKTAEGVEFIPEWGRNRMRGMLESRPDWCISRQRAWGLPIPGFLNGSQEVLLTEASVQAIADKLRQHGSDHWFKSDAAELLSDYDPQADPEAPAWLKDGSTALADLEKVNDIFDVWFESGSSWNAVMRQRGIGFPVDLYL
ncbi:MAG TPA: isoleucine--tRNA ligase, partial [Myxococcales bacterium]|nr:isoleucine--tRNA ligase [Myxococcales bacterium]